MALDITRRGLITGAAATVAATATKALPVREFEPVVDVAIDLAPMPGHTVYYFANRLFFCNCEGVMYKISGEPESWDVPVLAGD